MTQVADLVGVGTPGKIAFIAQRRVEDYPYTNCRIIELLGLLAFGGLDIGDTANRTKLVKLLRDATGIPEVVDGTPKGTNGIDVLRAIDKCLPWVSIACEGLADDALMASLADGSMQCSASTRYAKLSTHMRRFSPSFTGWHEIRLAGARVRDGVQEVLWIDCLGTGSYKGEWVAWRDVKPSLLTDNHGRVIATTMQRGAALSTLVSPARVFSPAAKVTIRKGAGLFAISAESGSMSKVGDAGALTSGTADAIVNVRNYPAHAPSGEFVRVISGPASGKYVRTSESDVTPVAAPGVSCDDAVAKATAPLKEQLGQAQSALATANARIASDKIAMTAAAASLTRAAA